MKKHSFTLIELLIVLVIIGILATLAVPQYQKLSIKARGAEAMTNLRAFGDSVWRYYLETGTFPQDPHMHPYVPPGLDITLPVSPGGNIQYDYEYYPPSYVIVNARHEEVYRKDAYGLVGLYSIALMYDIPSYYGYPGQKMDEHWYRYYICYVWTNTAGFGTFKVGWE